MENREMLELAAKAAGYTVNARSQAARDALVGRENAGLWLESGNTNWNPLNNSGQALDLAVRLNMGVSIHTGHCSAVAQVGFYCEERDADTAAATRRAIVRAAAEVGRVTISQPPKGEGQK